MIPIPLYLVLRVLLEMFAKIDFGKVFNELSHEFNIELNILANSTKKNKDNIIALANLNTIAIFYIIAICTLPIVKLLVLFWEIHYIILMYTPILQNVRNNIFSQILLFLLTKYLTSFFLYVH
jgi:hypothetical protein